MSVDKVTLDEFWKLSSENENKRISATCKIISYLEKTVASEKVENGTGNKKDAILYSCERCMKGLASSKETARKGFFLCLTEVLRLYHEQNTSTGSEIEELLDMIEQHLPTNNLSKGEEGEYLVGKCLCIGAIVYSNLVVKPEDGAVIVTQLLKFSSQRSYLKTIAYEYIVMYIKSIRPNTCSDTVDASGNNPNQIRFDIFKKFIWPSLSETCKYNGNDGCDADKLRLVLELVDVFPSILRDKAIMVDICGRKNLVTDKFIEEVASSLMGGGMSVKDLRQTSMLSKLVKLLMKETKMLKDFWDSKIDQAPSSNFKTVVKFSILDLIILNSNDPTDIPQYLTKNIITTMVLVLSRVESSTEEEAAILMVLEHLVEECKKNPELQKPLLKKLLQHPGKITFDEITGHGIVSKITLAAEGKTIKMLAKLYQEVLSGTETKKFKRANLRSSTACQTARTTSDARRTGVENKNPQFDSRLYTI